MKNDTKKIIGALFELISRLIGSAFFMALMAFLFGIMAFFVAMVGLQLIYDTEYVLLGRVAVGLSAVLFLVGTGMMGWMTHYEVVCDFEDFKKAIKPADKPKPVQASRVKQWKDVQIDYCVVPVSDFAPAPQSNMPIYISGTTTIS
jgi:hypothetical protein